jgi:mRNA-degrading endonuclease HigB of HigAB toxin-antitoxin module
MLQKAQKAATWKNSAEVAATFNTASILPDDRVVINIPTSA